MLFVVALSIQILADILIVGSSEKEFYCQMDIMGLKIFKYENVSKRFEEDYEHTPVLESMMKQYSLYFSLTIKGEIFNVLAHDSEPLTTLNLKRGLLSSLQTKLLSGEELRKRSAIDNVEPVAAQEVDVAGKSRINFILQRLSSDLEFGPSIKIFVDGICYSTGECLTSFNYEQDPHSNHLVIKKQKNPVNCSRRPMKIKSKSRSQFNEPTVNSNMEGFHKVDLNNQVITRSRMKEEHVMTPIEQGIRALSTHVSTFLKLLKISEAPNKRSLAVHSDWNSLLKFVKRSHPIKVADLVFEHEEELDEPPKWLK